MISIDQGTADRFYPMTNAEASPVHFRMAPQEQLKAELEIEDADQQLGIYHSHTRTRAYPSATDIGLAQHPGALYLILSLADDTRPDLRAFSIDGGQVSEEPVTITEG